MCLQPGTQQADGGTSPLQAVKAAHTGHEADHVEEYHLDPGPDVVVRTPELQAAHAQHAPAGLAAAAAGVHIGCQAAAALIPCTCKWQPFK